MLSLGVSRGFAFVEFYHFQDATSWMEANQVASLTKSRYSWKWNKSVQFNEKKKKGKNRGGRSGLFHNSDLKNKSFVYIKICNIEVKIRRESFTLVKGAIVLNDLVSI